MHATAFALGIHEDTGSLTYTSTTYRDIEALAACVRLGASQEQLGRYLRGPLSPSSATCCGSCSRPARSARSRACAWSRPPRRRTLRGGRLGTRLARRRHRRTGMCSSCASRWRARARGRAQPAPALAVDEALAALGGGGHAQAASALRARRRSGRACSSACSARSRASPARRCARGEVMSRPVHAVASGDRISATLVECQRLGLSGIQVSENGDLTGSRLARGPRPRRAPRPQPRAGQGRDELRRAVIGGEATLGELRTCSRPGSAGRLVVVGRRPVPRRGARAGRRAAGRRHARRRAAGAARAGERSSGRLPTRRQRRRCASAAAARSSACRQVLPAIEARRGRARRRVPRGRRRARRAARGAEPRPRLDGGGRCDRVRPRAGARSSG